MSATPSMKLQEIILKNNSTHVSDISNLVLQKLTYPEMTHRHQRIALAHQRTFEWIFEPPQQPVQWSNFENWIQHDESSLYWITGKPGAGKSTMMRFLVDHRSTKRLLKVWSKDRRLLVASFFFWNSGTSMQMSYEGLVRSLLYQVLNQVPHLTSIALPHRVSDGLLLGDAIFRSQEWSWTWDEPLGALKTLLHEATKTYAMAFFIDGMDEFNGETSGLIDLVKRLVMPGVKVCASSRPWNQFRDAFDHEPHLQIEQLTKQDIESFVASKLTSSVAFRSYEQTDPGFSAQLIEDVCEKSEGVFLWVFLVCNSLLEGLSDGEKRSELHTRLDSLPTDLEDLFEKILAGINPTQAGRASAMLQIHKSWLKRNSSGTRQYKPPLTLLEMFHADEEDIDYAINAPCDPLSPEGLRSRADLMHRRLRACTKGLLETNVRSAEHIWLVEITLLHRTVKDYLNRQDIWAKICASSPTLFRCNARLCNSSIMRMKTRDSNDQLSADDLWNAASCAAEYVKIVQKEDPDLAAKLLVALDEALLKTVWSTVFDGEGLATLAKTDLDHCREVCGNVLRTAMYCNTFSYVRQELGALPRHTRSLVASECLRTVVDKNQIHRAKVPRALQHDAPNVELVHCLLLEGADPNYKVVSDIFSTWGLVLERSTEMTEKSPQNTHISITQFETMHAIIEDFILFGADLWHPELASYLRKTPVHTAYIYELLEQKKRQLPSSVSQQSTFQPMKAVKQKKTRFWRRVSSRLRT